MDVTTSEKTGARRATPAAHADPTQAYTRQRTDEDDPSAARLPAEPVVSIRPSKSWVALDLRSVWAYRELLYFLTWRDIKVRYKQTALGAAWAVLQPTLMMVIFTLFFGRLAGIPSDGVPYPLFAYAGLLPWTFFSNSVTNSGNSLVGSSHLITKVYFPRMIIPGAAVAAGVVDLLLGFVVLVPLMLYYGVSVGPRAVVLVPLVLLTSVLALAVGMWTSALNVKYRDVRFALPFLIQLWMFASPVIYPLSKVPREWQWVLALNPMTGVIQGFRAALFGQEFNWPALGVSALITFALLAYAAYFFRHMEKSFADIV
jgi:lipopolysaccharide transport system permease protein